MQTERYTDRHVHFTHIPQRTDNNKTRNSSFVVVAYGAGALYVVSWPCDVGSRGCHIDLVYALDDWRALEFLAKLFQMLSERKRMMLRNDSKHRISAECVSQYQC